MTHVHYYLIMNVFIEEHTMKKLMLLMVLGLVGCGEYPVQKVDVVVSFECHDVLYVNVKQYINDELRNEKTDNVSMNGEYYKCKN